MIFASQILELAKYNSLPGEDLIIEAQNKLDAIGKDVPCFNSLKDAPEVIRLSTEAGLKRMELYQQGITCTGIPTGIPALDTMFGGWQDGDLNILAARPSMGKTALALFFAQMACQSNRHVVIYSLEMNAVKLGDRMLIAKSNVEANHWRLGNCNNLEFEAIEHAGNYLSDLPFHIDDTSIVSLNQIKASARRMQQKGLCDLLIIDYLQLIEMKAETRVQTRQELVLQASRKAKCIAKDLNIPVLLLSQLNRESENKPGKRPELSNLRESGAIEQDADTVILIHRPEYYGID